MARKGKKTSAAQDPIIDELVSRVLASEDPMAAINELAGLMKETLLADMMPENSPIALPDPPLHPNLLTVRVDLTRAKPPIWRRLAVRGELTLDQVHDYLQAAMGWHHSHLHRFCAPGVQPWDYPHFITEFDEDEGDEGTREEEVRLDQVLREKGDWLHYLYDFGDGWIHRITVESVRPVTDEDPPAVCLAGRGECPLEDIGGIDTWMELAAALREDPDPSHLAGHLAEFATWFPSDLDPDHFDVDETNAQIGLVGAEPATAEELFEELAKISGAGQQQALTPAFDELLLRCSPELVTELAALSSAALDATLATPEELTATLQPWQSVLDLADADGIPLTQAGWMAPAACEVLYRDSGVARGIGKGNREPQTPELHRLRQECQSAKLIRRHKGRLVLTPLGRRAAVDQEVLAAAVADSLVAGEDEFVRDARVVTALLLAAGWEPAGDGWSWRDELVRVLNKVGWHQETGFPLDDYQMYGVPGPFDLIDAQDRARTLRAALPSSPGARTLARLALFVEDEAEPA